MKKLSLLLITGVILFGCNDEKKQEKSLLDEIVKLHEKVMADDEAVMKNKVQLNTLAAHVPATKDSVSYYKTLLGNADDVMMDWMNKFNPDYSGKSHTEAIDYLNKQKEQIIKVDQQLNKAISLSNNYLKSQGK